jgi:hypothetical protein
MFVWRWRQYDDKYKAGSIGDKSVRTCFRCVGVILDNTSVQRIRRESREYTNAAEACSREIQRWEELLK